LMLSQTASATDAAFSFGVLQAANERVATNSNIVFIFMISPFLIEEGLRAEAV